MSDHLPVHRCPTATAPIPGRTAHAVDWSIGLRGWQGGLGDIGSGVRLLLLMLILALSGCSREAEETRLRATIADMQAAAEARRPAAVVESVSAEFVGSHGLDRDGLRRLLQAQMLGKAQVGVSLGPLDVELQAGEARVRFVALTTGGSGRLLPEQARAYRVSSRWRLEGGDWRVYQAEWVDDPG
jgi:hypothetical protein